MIGRMTFLLYFQAVGALRARMVQFCVIVPPVFFSILVTHLHASDSPGAIVAKAGTAASLLSIWTVLVFTALVSIDTEKIDGTLAAQFVSPSSFAVNLFVKVVGSLTVALMTVPLSFFVSAAILYHVPTFSHPMAALAGLGMFSITAMSFSMVIGALIALSRSTRVLMNVIEYPVFILSGIVIPISIMPEPIKLLSYFVPFSHTTELVRYGVSGGSSNYFDRYSPAIIATGLSLAAAVSMIRIIVIRIRTVGRLDLA